MLRTENSQGIKRALEAASVSDSASPSSSPSSKQSKADHTQVSVPGNLPNMSENADEDESLEFLATPDELALKLEMPVDTVTFENFCRPALKCLITEGIDLNGLRGPSAPRRRASVHVVLRAPFHLTFSSLAEMSDSGTADEGFTKVPMPHSVRGKVWHALEVLAVLADPAFATTIHSYTFQHVCDAAVIAHFLHNDEAFQQLSPSKTILSALLLPGSKNAASVREVENLRVLMQLPDDILTHWLQSMRPKDVLMLPQTAINVWCSKTYPLTMDLKSSMLGFPQLISLASALRSVPKLQELSLRLRTHKKSHGKAYRDAICHPPPYMFKDDYSAQQTGCAVCAKCKDDERLSVLAAATPCLPELQRLELVECLFDYGSARQFMWLLAPLSKLEVLKIGDGGGQWLFHCARWSLCSAAATLPALTTLDLQGNAWNMLSCVLKPLTRAKSLKAVHLNGSVIVDTIPEALKDKVQGDEMLAGILGVVAEPQNAD